MLALDYWLTCLEILALSSEHTTSNLQRAFALAAAAFDPMCDLAVSSHDEMR